MFQYDDLHFSNAWRPYICIWTHFKLNQINTQFYSTNIPVIPFVKSSSQGWELTLSLISSSLFCSKSLILKNDPERFTHNALYKRVTVSELLMMLVIFCMFLTVSPFFMPKSELLQSLFALLLFFKEWLEWLASIALYTRAVVSDLLRWLMTGVIHTFSQANRSFDNQTQKLSNYLKNRWANSQSWFFQTIR